MGARDFRPAVTFLGRGGQKARDTVAAPPVRAGCGDRPLTAKPRPSALDSRRHSSSTASAEESKLRRARWRRPRWTDEPPWPGQPLLQHAHAGGGFVVRELGWAGPASRAPGQPLALPLLRAASAAIRPSMPLAVDLLRELGAVGVDQPDAQHIEVVDLPAGALAGRLLEAVVELHRIAAASDLGAHQHVLVVGRAAERADGDGLVAHLVERAGIGAHQQGLELVLQALLLFGRCSGARPGRPPRPSCAGS